MPAYSRIKTNTVYDLLGIQSLHFCICVKFVEIADTQCKICIGKKLYRFRFRESHKESINIFFYGTFLKKFCKSLCSFHKSFIIHIRADNDTARIEIIIECL